LLLGCCQICHRLRSSFPGVPGFCLLVLEIALRSASGLGKPLRGLGGIDPLLRFERRLVRLELSQFKLLANDRISNA
jgi:hypothetical protein